MHRQLADALEASGLFDAEWYRTTYPDIEDGPLSPWEHFLQHGLQEGRAPGPGFSPAEYLAANPDVSAAELPAMEHYLRWGRQEGRLLSRTLAWPEAPLPNGLPDWVGLDKESPATDVPPAEGERILYVLSIQSGGTPQTNQDLMRAVEARAECLVLRCTGQEMVLYLFHSGIYVRLATHRLQEPVEPLPHVSAEYDRVVERWLVAYRVTLVHVRHLAWQGLGLIATADRLGLPVVCSFHDYYAICPSVKLLDENQQFCGGRCTASRGECAQELWAPELMPALKHEGIYSWQQQFAGALALCHGFVTTTEAARDLVLEIFPALATRPFAVIPHGRDFTELATLAECPEPDGPLRVLVPGFIAVSKGSGVLLELAEHPELSHVEWHVLGTLAGTQAMPLPSNVIVHGPYARDTFAAHVASIRPHLGAVLSLWPETWCHTLTELWSVGVPVLGFDIGAVGERLAASGGGWRVSPLNAEAAAETLIRASQPQEWRCAAESVLHWQQDKQISTTQMAEAYWQLYQQVVAAR
ncbi:glycosyltransferase [Halomonas organivorans]|uniref:Glycosyltransferase involved in cell wall biosynthesis n=1 Tax=Halomonas organivorans TaxID=257772 RepID=A0A7W5C0Q8_9GAMM|nr:glycosyltransferase [Halomonas organivorans]MBB3142619.1 glycosyltransferase involved in cell wall biosynthesis [Halomonas organivorans]